MTTDNLFIPDNIPDDAKMLSSEKYAWLAYLLVVPILAIAYLRSSAKIAKKSLLTIRVKDNYSAYKSEHMKPPFNDDFAC